MVRPRASFVGVFFALVSLAAMSGVAFAADGPSVVAGYKDGPVTLVSGTTPAQVASLHLTAGRWLVWAKLYVVNTTTHSGANVICTLKGPGSTATSHRMDVTAAGDQDGVVHNQPNALATGAVVPSGGGNVILRCSANGAGSQVKAQHIKIMAMRVARQTTVNLANGNTSSVGTGTPAVIIGSRPGPISLPGYTDTLIADLSLPAGNWWLRSILDLTTTDNDGGSCWVTVGSTDQDRLNFRRDHGRTQAVVLDAAVHLVNPAHARVYCSGYANSGVASSYLNHSVKNIRVTALKVGTLTMLDNGHAFGTTVPKVRYATSQATFFSINSSWTPTNPLLDVAAGDWMFMAKANISGVAPLIACELRALPDYDRSAMGGNGDITMPFELVHHFAASGSTRVYCQALSATPTPVAGTIHIAGFRLGSVTNVALP